MNFFILPFRCGKQILSQRLQVSVRSGCPLCFFKSEGSTFITEVWHHGPGIKKMEPYDFMLSTNVASIIREGKKKKQRGLFEEQSVLESQTRREKELIDDMHSASVCVGTFAASFVKLRYCCFLKPRPAVETTTSVNSRVILP